MANCQDKYGYDLQNGDRVKIAGFRDESAFFAKIVSCKPSGTIVVDREDKRDGAGNPIRLYVPTTKTEISLDFASRI